MHTCSLLSSQIPWNWGLWNANFEDITFRQVCSVRMNTDLSTTDLKVHRDGRACPFFLVIGGQQLNFSTQLTLLHTSHTLDPEIQTYQVVKNKNKKQHTEAI